MPSSSRKAACESTSSREIPKMTVSSFGELLLAVAEVDGLQRAAGRAIARVEIEDDVLLPAEAGEMHHLHRGVGQRKRRGRMSNL